MSDARQNPNHPNVNLIRSNVAGNGDTTFVDYDNLHPQNEAAAMLTGAGGGFVTGGLLVGTAALLDVESMSKKSVNIVARHPIISAAVVAVPAVIGAVVGLLQARTHNNWSNKVLDSIERQKIAEQQNQR